MVDMGDDGKITDVVKWSAHARDLAVNRQNAKREMQSARPDRHKIASSVLYFAPAPHTGDVMMDVCFRWKKR
ncbi:hypothetical protein BLX87_24280 [Bacillus sp. VT-16-64]|nr:hypothetical protein BLX87_24280 [Bacillus sp. VT-16-64]